MGIYMAEANVNSNNCGGNKDPAVAEARVKDLIDVIYSKLPKVTIVLSTLVKSKDNSACAGNLSQQYRDLVAINYRSKRMGRADIDSVVQMSQLNDSGIHPSADGYKLFAGVWWAAMSKLEGALGSLPAHKAIFDCNNGQIRLAAVQDLPGLEIKASTVALRDRMNDGVDAFSIMIQVGISEVQQSLTREDVNNKQIHFVDISSAFEAHRRKGRIDRVWLAEFTSRAWFFLPIQIGCSLRRKTDRASRR